MKRLRHAAVFAVSVTAFLAPGTAVAATAPGYEQFSDCPDRSVNSAITGCAVTEVVSGHLQMGSKDTPIVDPIRLVVGFDVSGNATLGSFDGGRQRIPGGLIGITGLDWLRFIYPLNALQIYAEPELAGPVTSAFPPIGLPLKVQLHNVLLNNSCYIGANNDPIALNLITGTTAPPPPNQPITGSDATSFAEHPTLPDVFLVGGIKLVDNEFAAPAARNCDLLSLNLLVTGLVNLQSGLPSAAGTNEAIQNVNLTLATTNAVYPPNGIE